MQKNTEKKMRKHINYLLILTSIVLFASCKKESSDLPQTVPGENKVKMEYISGLGAPDLSPATSSKIGKPVEMNWQFKNMKGETVLLSDFKGKVIFLNLWATWCPPCKAELPSVEKLMELADKEVVFLLVSNETQDEVKSFFQPIDSSLPAFTAEGEYPADFVTQGIPATYIIDKKGNLAAFHLGAAQWDDASVVNFLNSLK